MTHTRAQLIEFVQNRLTHLDGTAADLTYLTQAGYASHILIARSEWQWRINGHNDHRAAFDAKIATLGTDPFSEIDGLITQAEGAGTETARTNLLAAAFHWCKIVQAIMLDVIGGADTW